MATVAKLKEKARSYEHQEQWQDALLAYEHLIEQADGDQSSLWNRVGDLRMRLGNADDAVEAYEQAVEAYCDAGLHNNAIALCNKILRATPARSSTYLRLGQLTATQGFLADARNSFLQFADHMRREGNLDAAFSALKEFAALSPGDVAVRQTLADQLHSNDRTDEAIEQLRLLIGYLQSHDRGAEADAARQKILEMDPGADVSALGGAARANGGASPARSGMLGLDLLPTIEYSAPPAAPAAPAAPAPKLPAESRSDDAELHIEIGEADDEAPGIKQLPGFEATASDEVAEFSDDGMLLDIEVTAPDDDETGTEDTSEWEAAAGPLPASEEVNQGAAIGWDSASEDDIVSAISPLEGLEATVHEDDWDSEDEPEALPLLATSGEPLTVEAEEPQITADFDAPAEDSIADSIAADADTYSLEAYVSHAPALPEDFLAYMDEGPDLAADSLPQIDSSALQDFSLAREDDQRVDFSAAAEDDQPVDLPFLSPAREADTTAAPSPIDAEEDEPWSVYVDKSGASSGSGAHGAPPTPPAGESPLPDLGPPFESDSEIVAAAESAPVPAPSPAPPPSAAPAADEGYVDLAALIFEDEPPPASTRFVVPEEEPSGDEERDFADMLSQFRQKVNENIGVEDSSSHYDLGLAFKDMGLLDEAIAQFQVALQGGANPLATLEVLGECFIEKGQYTLAAKVLERAVRLPQIDEGDLVGVFYWLGRCNEMFESTAAARDFYERVLAFDIRFRDVAARVQALGPVPEPFTL